MTDPTLPHGELPPIPDGCGILPVAENRIARGPHPQLLDAVPEGFSPLASQSAGIDEPLNDALEQTYRRVLARALALASAAMLLTAAVAASLAGNGALSQSFLAGQLIVHVIFITQVMFLGLCSRYVPKLGIVPAAVLLYAYAAFCGLEFSALLSPATLAVVFLCAGLMYAVTALWGFLLGSDLARPFTAIFMILAGGAILAAVNLALGSPNLNWSLSSVAVVIFAGLASCHAQQIRDFYQDFDDDNAQGWKASVLGALLLLVNLVNLYLLLGSALSRDREDRDPTDDLSR
ncbi:MAG: Bax inhibitor-1 family protein [Candidatus Korobacteraceae bacterium]